jgi:GNAT superfamily N-acetyltransferase
MVTYAQADDRQRAVLLRGRGYDDRGPTEVLHRRPLGGRLPSGEVPPGYRIRQPDLADDHDRERFIAITRQVFGVTFDVRAIQLESRMLTHREYFVAEADDGVFASWCGVWAAPEVGAGQFEPVGTHPDHRRRGLASAVMARGLDWMRERGLDGAFVGTGARNASNQLYASLGFELVEAYHQWAWSPAVRA